MNRSITKKITTRSNGLRVISLFGMNTARVCFKGIDKMHYSAYSAKTKTMFVRVDSRVLSLGFRDFGIYRWTPGNSPPSHLMIEIARGNEKLPNGICLSDIYTFCNSRFILRQPGTDRNVSRVFRSTTHEHYFLAVRALHTRVPFSTTQYCRVLITSYQISCNRLVFRVIL